MPAVNAFLLRAALERKTQYNQYQFMLTATSNPDLIEKLNLLIDKAPKNGIDTPKDLEQRIVRVCSDLEFINPTKSPVNSDLINGFWRMLWTNFAPAAPSSGKLGPLVGTVYQNLNLPAGEARNILKVDFPPIAGELFATPQIVNDSTVAITFMTVGNKIFGSVPLGPKIEFEKGKEVRLWEHIYLDSAYRILYARRANEPSESRGFIFIMKRAEDERFETGV